MKKHKFLLTVSFALLGKLLFAQSSETIKNYIATYKDIAIEEMLRTGVPASITLAQGIHETGAGTSLLVKKSNNHFGIKCKSDWKGASVSHDDDARGECFRKYDDPMQSYKDHSDFLKYRPHYASLFKLDPTDYESWAYGLKKAGYATNPKYPQILIKLIKDYNLQEYTLIALNGRPAGNDAVWTSNTSNESAQEAKVTEAVVVEPQPMPVLNYPSGIFKINDTRVLLVAKGTAFLRIAEDNDVALSRLFEFNDMKPADIAGADMLIFLQRKRKTGANEFHVVLQGETLHSIAQAEGIRLENLLELNLLGRDMQPAPGERLYLKDKAPVMPRLYTPEPVPASAQPGSAQQSKEFIIHTVQPKETVYAIARKYEVTIDEVMTWNSLDSVALKNGQQIRIYKKSANASH
ncbi:MAG TPA: glucosaminidase domain-containing protein [Flavisolibacter sp.]|nr:glucosaminidase domain-containing protein [Flavisolibacter sp.]